MLTAPTTAFLSDPEIDAAVSAAYEEDLSSDGYVNNLTRAFATVNDALGAVPDRELIARVPPRVREAITFGRVNTVDS